MIYLVLLYLQDWQKYYRLKSVSFFLRHPVYLYKVAIFHHGMQSFHIIVYCTPVYCTLFYCTIADRSDRFATSISLREHANERYAAQNIW